MRTGRVMTSKRSRGGGDGSGFTILELMVTTGVLAVAIVGLVQLFVCCMWQSENAGHLTTAVNEAYGKWEEIRAVEFGDIVTRYSPQGTLGDTFSLAGLDGRGVLYLDTSRPNILLVDVVVCWRERGNMVYGEDQNLNGVLDAGEDLNQNGRLDSPAELTSLVARR